MDFVSPNWWSLMDLFMLLDRSPGIVQMLLSTQAMQNSEIPGQRAVGPQIFCIASVAQTA